MASLLQSRPGVVQVLDLGVSGAPGILTIKGDGSLTEQAGVIVTKIGINQDVNIQFMQSLQKIIYAYSFGDRMGQVIVSGLTFHSICKTATPGSTQAPEDTAKYTGATNLLTYYDKNRAIDEGRLMTVTIGTATLQGYLISMGLDTSSTEFKTMGFNLRITTIPKQVGIA